MKKKRSNKVLAKNAAQQRIADAIVNKVIGIQLRWAVLMQMNTERLPEGLKKFILFFLFFSSGCYSLYLIVAGFTGKHGNAIGIQFVHMPQPAPAEMNSGPLIAEVELKKIEAFRLRIDSLQMTVSGKQIADSILAGRSGLMDSIRQLELIYHSLKK